MSFEINHRTAPLEVLIETEVISTGLRDSHENNKHSDEMIFGWVIKLVDFAMLSYREKV